MDTGPHRFLHWGHRTLDAAKVIVIACHQNRLCSAPASSQYQLPHTSQSKGTRRLVPSSVFREGWASKTVPPHLRGPQALLRQGKGRPRWDSRRGWRTRDSPPVFFSSASWIRHPMAGLFFQLRGGTCLAVLDLRGRIARCSK